MFVDARKLRREHPVVTDVCIVGGGAAGLTIARELTGEPVRVMLLERGGLEARSPGNDCDEILCEGLPYPTLGASRVRALGGTTHIWGGWSTPLGKGDFEPRDWVPHSGWPFPLHHLEPYYRRAHAAYGLGPYDYTPDAWFGLDSPEPLANSPHVDEFLFQIAPTRFGAAHLRELRSATNVDVMLHAHAIELLVGDNADSVRGVSVRAPDGTRLVIEARIVVLAAGGIENPRILLASRKHTRAGIGNEHDLVGRFFFEHLHVQIGTLSPPSCADTSRYQARRVNRTTVRVGLTISDAVQAQERMLGSAVTLHNANNPHDVLSPGAARSGYRSLMTILRAVQHGRSPDALFTHLATIVREPVETLRLVSSRVFPAAPTRLSIGVRAEQSPNPQSRVRLDEARDSFGAHLARLDWKLREQDFDSIAKTQSILAATPLFRDAQFLPRDGECGWGARVLPAAHHMGTTRMHRESRNGVVDENCRVHGTRNVYVAGSSTFPNGGWAPPTLTIVALAARLADHIRRRLQ
jgi:choline dehydrogenase-like flavoprotein